MACGCLPGCPDENWLAAYAEGGLTQAERTGVEAHLASCRGCRAGLLFASLGVLEEAPKVAVELEPAQAPRQIRICVVVKDAVARVEQFFEETLELLVAPLGRRVAPEFRGADGVRTSQVRLGPFELSLQRERPAGGGLDIGVTKQHMPLAETWTTFMLSSGQKVEARTDSRGWLHIADIALDQVECIWINVLA
jgi:hypothetical protein